MLGIYFSCKLTLPHPPPPSPPPSFTVQTLQCIVRQLGINPNEYIHWIEKSMYIKTIEEIYAQNSTAFNMKVIPTCGILLGYLYRPKGERAYSFNSSSIVQFHKLDIAFDASSLYYPYKTFLVGSLLFSWLFLKAIFYLLLYLFHAVYQPTLIVHPNIKKHLNTLQMDSLEELDDLLLKTTEQNNYYNRLFLVRNRYLLILNIDWNEDDPSTLRHFYIYEPVTMIYLSNIISIEFYQIGTRYIYDDIWFSLPRIPSQTDIYGSKWLHQKLMTISAKYRN